MQTLREFLSLQEELGNTYRKLIKDNVKLESKITKPLVEFWVWIGLMLIVAMAPALLAGLLGATIIVFVVVLLPAVLYMIRSAIYNTKVDRFREKLSEDAEINLVSVSRFPRTIVMFNNMCKWLGINSDYVSLSYVNGGKYSDAYVFRNDHRTYVVVHSSILIALEYRSLQYAKLILMHELAHVKHGDENRWITIDSTIRSYFKLFHPALVTLAFLGTVAAILSVTSTGETSILIIPNLLWFLLYLLHKARLRYQSIRDQSELLADLVATMYLGLESWPTDTLDSTERPRLKLLDSYESYEHKSQKERFTDVKSFLESNLVETLVPKGGPASS